MEQNSPRTAEMPDIFAGAEKKKRPATVTILKPLKEVTSFFGDFSYFAATMPELERVESIGGKRHRWYSRGDGLTWETELFVEELPHRIAWRSAAGSSLDTVGAVTFEPALNGRGTVVSMKLAHQTSSKKFMDFLKRFRGEDPDTQAATTLRRFKALLEAGEIPTTEGQPSGREEAAAA